MFEKPCGYKNTHTSEIIRKQHTNNSQNSFNDELNKLIDFFKNSFTPYLTCFK